MPASAVTPADDSFRLGRATELTSASSTKRSPRPVGICAAAHDRLRPDASVCDLGSARLLLSSRERGPGYRNGNTPIAPIWCA